MQTDIYLSSFQCEFKEGEKEQLKRKVDEIMDPIHHRHNEQISKKKKIEEDAIKLVFAKEIHPFVKDMYTLDDCKQIEFCINIPHEYPEEGGRISSYESRDDVDQDYPGQYSIELILKDYKSKLMLKLNTCIEYDIDSGYNRYYTQFSDIIDTNFTFALTDLNANELKIDLAQVKLVMLFYKYIINKYTKLNEHDEDNIHILNQSLLYDLFASYFTKCVECDASKEYIYDDVEYEEDHMHLYYVDKKESRTMYIANKSQV